jgi:hypothetical protein
MNRKQLLTLTAVGITVIILGILLYRRDSASWQRQEAGVGRLVLAEFNINDVTHVRIQNATNELNLVKTNDSWKVRERANYAANFTEISDLVRKMSELKAVQTLKVGPSQFARLDLVKPGNDGTNIATVVEFKDKNGQTLRSFLLGKKYMRESRGGPGGDWPAGRYILAGEAATVAVVNDPLSNVEPKADAWLNKDFFKVEKLRSMSVEHPAETNRWRMTRETETSDWQLADKKEGEELDKNKTYSVNSAFSYPSFNDVAAADATPADTGLDQPIVASLETFDQFSYQIRVGKKTADDNYFMALSANAGIPTERTPGKDEKPEDKEKLDKEFKEKNDKLKEKLQKEKSLEGTTFLVSKWTIDSILKERREFLADKKPAEGKDNANTNPDPSADGVPPLPTDFDLDLDKDQKSDKSDNQ